MRVIQKQGNLRKTGNLDIFCGYFGNGKTLSLVKQVVCREYKRYDGLTVWCNRRQKSACRTSQKAKKCRTGRRTAYPCTKHPAPQY